MVKKRKRILKCVCGGIAALLVIAVVVAWAMFVTMIKAAKDLAQIVLEMLASLNTMQKEKDRLIEITADGQITGDEIRDFIHIQEELEQISIAVETLQLWSERMLATGAIDPELYRSYKGE